MGRHQHVPFMGRNRGMGESLLDISVVPVLYKGPWDEDVIAGIWDGQSKATSVGGTSEGYVVRTAGSFSYGDFGKNVAKFVRPNHVQTDTHWMQSKIVPNKLKPQ